MARPAPWIRSRALVAGDLWPDAHGESARANLRTAVWAARAALGEAFGLEASRTSLTLSGVELDLDDPPSAEHEPAELLPEFDDDWVIAARSALADRRARDWSTAARRALDGGDSSSAVTFARRLTELRPLDEAAHRLLIDSLLTAGEQAAAVVAAQDFTRLLKEELGARPSPATRAAHARFRTGTAAEPRIALFGRADEMAWLLDRWREAARGAGLVVLLTGESGIGKSTLVNELARRVGAFGALAARSVGMDAVGETPFAVALELAQSVAAGVPAVPAQATWPAELNRLDPGLGGRLGHPEPPLPVTAPELERLRVHEALLGLVEWSCRERPTLLVIDDAHRADRASLQLAAHLARRLPGLPAMLLLTSRDQARRPELDAVLADLAGRGVRVETRSVPPIEDSAIAALARSLDLGPERVDQVVAAAEGNPLLAVETARAVVAGNPGPPPGLRASVTAALGRSSPEVRALANLLAAAGRPLWPEELKRLKVAVPADLITDSQGMLVRRDGRLGFRHELLRAAVYSDLPDPVALHDRLADGIDPSGHVQRAHHLALAGRVRESSVALAAAAAAARAVGALNEAAELLERAVQAAPDDGRLWLELQEVYAWASAADRSGTGLVEGDHPAAGR